jgi:tetrahydromethanopterin S-methyltransferase subunit B
MFSYWQNLYLSPLKTIFVVDMTEKNDPIIQLVDKISNLESRVLKLESKTDYLEKSIGELKDKIRDLANSFSIQIENLSGWVKNIDSRVFTILVGVIISILLQILFRVWR